VEVRDGKIWAEDDAGGGATFHMVLPTVGGDGVG
jgi:hypothetical protein